MYLWLDIGICMLYFTDATVCAVSSVVNKTEAPSTHYLQIDPNQEIITNEK